MWRRDNAVSIEVAPGFWGKRADPLDAQQLWETMIANLAKLLKHG
jgi:hypothetical protein